MRKIRLNLQDFAAVVIINLGVSLLVALFLFLPDRQNRIEAEEKIFAFRCEVEVGKYTFLYVDTF